MKETLVPPLVTELVHVMVYFRRLRKAFSFSFFSAGVRIIHCAQNTPQATKVDRRISHFCQRFFAAVSTETEHSEEKTDVSPQRSAAAPPLRQSSEAESLLPQVSHSIMKMTN